MCILALAAEDLRHEKITAASHNNKSFDRHPVHLIAFSFSPSHSMLVCHNWHLIVLRAALDR